MMLLDSYPQNNPEVYVAWLGDKTLDKALELTQNLREADIKTNIDYNPKSMKAHMKKADRLKVKNCIIIGEEELEKGLVVLKDFTTREQKEVSFDKILEELKGE